MSEFDLRRFMAYDVFVAPLGDEHMENLLGEVLYLLRMIAGDKDADPEQCIPYRTTRRPQRKRQSTASMRAALREAVQAAGHDDVIVSDERAE